MTPPYVTTVPWAGGLVHASYGALDTYHKAAAWLSGCTSIDDWGGGAGFFGSLLPPGVRYRVIDGTLQAADQTLAALETFSEPADGILIRHVLDINTQWEAILANAMQAFRRRMVVVTFTPDAAETDIEKLKSGWPVMHFNPADLRARMGDFLVREEALLTTHPERIYYLERPA